MNMDISVEHKRYTPLPNGSNAGDECLFHDSIHAPARSQRWAFRLRSANSLWTAFNALLFVLITVTSSRSCKYSHCTEKDRNTYSPAYDWFEVTTEARHFNNSFWGDHTLSLLRQPPSPESDAAWEAVSGTEGISVTADEARKMGRNPATMWPWPDEVMPGSGRSYIGMLDIFHQLHCLDMMRRAAWPEYYGDLRAKYANLSFPFEEHQLHCQYLLFNVLTCHADLEVITFHKVRDFSSIFPDFAVDRTCRRFDDILAWKNKHMVLPSNGDAWKFEFPTDIVQVDPIGLTKPWMNIESS